MTWDGDTTTIHHRDENSLSDFINTTGGLLGDTRLMFRYLLYNDGQGSGRRLFFGGGLVFPSKNTITSDPFFLNGEEKTEHRHFSISEGAYKALAEIQIFKKRSSNPVFYGLVGNVEVPLSESRYEFMPGISYSCNISVLYNNKKYDSEKNLNLIPIGFPLGLSFIGLTEASWHEVPTPNSESQILVPSIGAIWKLGEGSISISLQKPIFISGQIGSDDNPLNNKANAFEIVFGYRRNLGYMIPWL